jgi:hypothetical protein
MNKDTETIDSEKLKTKYNNTGVMGITFYQDSRCPSCYGYMVRYNKKQKRFLDSKYSMEERLQQAKDYLRNLQQKDVDVEQTSIIEETNQILTQNAQIGGASNNDSNEEKVDYRKKYDEYEYINGYTDDEIKYSLDQALEEIQSFKRGEIPLKERTVEIYKITGPENKCYVGQSYSNTKTGKKMGGEKRWKDHIYNSINRLTDNTILDNAIKNIGKDNFKIEILHIINESIADAYEEKEIIEQNALYPNGYNLGLRNIHNKNSSILSSLKQKGKERPNKIKRNVQEDDDLPKGVIRYNDKDGTLIGYKATRIDKTNKVFVSCTLTMDQKKELAIKFRNGENICEKGGHVEVFRKNEQSMGLPKYISYKKSSSGAEGYKIAFLPLKGKIEGFQHEKTFVSKNRTLEESKQSAILYLKQCEEKYKQFKLTSK